MGGHGNGSKGERGRERGRAWFRERAGQGKGGKAVQEGGGEEGGAAGREKGGGLDPARHMRVAEEEGGREKIEAGKEGRRGRVQD